jgi:uncharacterized protein YndB with AHSA1/START domain
MKEKLLALLTTGLTFPFAANAELAPIYIHRCVDADIQSVWQSWTTADGVRAFFSRDAIVEPRIDGEYSVLFFPENPKGLRGAENMRVVAIEPENRLLVTWNNPPRFETIREQRALVEYRLSNKECGTLIRIKHFGWGQSEEWSQAREYFQGAWETILRRLEYSYEHGPLDWDNLPEHLWYRGPGAAATTATN